MLGQHYYGYTVHYLELKLLGINVNEYGTQFRKEYNVIFNIYI